LHNKFWSLNKISPFKVFSFFIPMFLEQVKILAPKMRKITDFTLYSTYQCIKTSSYKLIIFSVSHLDQHLPLSIR
jgi:hypothetical protein